MSSSPTARRRCRAPGGRRSARTSGRGGGVERQRSGGGGSVSGAVGLRTSGGSIRSLGRSRRRPAAGASDRPRSDTGGGVPRRRPRRRGPPGRPQLRPGTTGPRPSPRVTPRRRSPRRATGGGRTGADPRTGRDGRCVWRGIGLLSSSDWSGGARRAPRGRRRLDRRRPHRAVGRRRTGVESGPWETIARGCRKRAVSAPGSRGDGTEESGDRPAAPFPGAPAGGERRNGVADGHGFDPAVGTDRAYVHPVTEPN